MNAALTLVDNIERSKSANFEMNDIRQELLLEMLKLQCNCTLGELVINTNKLLKVSSPQLHNLNIQYNINLSSIVKCILDNAIDTVWELQLKSLREIGIVTIVIV